MKQIISPVLIISLIFLLGYIYYFEPEVISAATSTATASFTLTVTEQISLTAPTTGTTMSAITMSSNTSTNIASGANWLVKTNSADGWKLEFKADQTNCMDNGTNQFTDYTEASTGTPESWSVSSAYEFGFSAYGTYVSSTKWGTPDDCTNALMKHMGFQGTTDIYLASNDSTTSTSGSTVYMCVKAEQDSLYAPNGSYTADITGTATSAP